MRILHIGKYYHPYSGGMESIIKDLCEGLHQRGHDVTVLCSHTSLKKETEILNGVKVVRIPRLGVFFGQNINPTLYSEMHRLAKDADLVHVHGPNPLGEVLALSLPRSTTLVSTHHSDIIRQKFLLKLYRPFLNRFLKRMQRIFVPTENHIAYSDFLPQFQKKCEIIPFGIKYDYLKSNEKNLKYAQKFKKEYGPYALFVGRLVTYKGIETLIQAAQETAGKVIIVGTGPLRGQLEKQILSLNLKDKVKVLGRVDDKDSFVGLYHGCDMLVLPSISANENFGIVQLEAMACSKPVVTTNLRSGVPAVGVKGKTTLIVEPQSFHQLSHAMNMIFLNGSLKNKMGRAGYQHFQKFYTWDGMVEGQIEAYRRVKEVSQVTEKYHGQVA